jgi:16S rRNA (cytosine967-C5)-methyltransferase
MTTARELVTKRLIGQVRRFPDLDIHPLDTTGLDGRDASLALAIDHAVARRWLTLQTVIASRLTRPWDRADPAVRAVLLAGAAQLLLMERLPDHAVINESVELAKRLAHPKTASFINAVLRKIASLRRGVVDRFDASRRDELPLHDGRSLRLAEDVFDEEPESRLAQQTSHPGALLARWTAAFGASRAREIAMHDLVHPPIIIAGTEGLRDHEYCRPHDTPGFFVFIGPRDRLEDVLAVHPGARVQDPGSAEPVRSTLSFEPDLIVDACAGKGTKTVQLAAMHARARIVATDRDPVRLGILRATFEHHDRVEIVAFDELARFSGQADMLVLDVPCSNTGVLARRVEARYRFSDRGIEALVETQRQIVADTLALLSDHGRLLYATCSLESTENDGQARWIERWHPMRVVDSALRMPAGGPGDPPEQYADGGYFALLERTGG